MTIAIRSTLLILRYNRARREREAQRRLVESTLRAMGVTPGSAEQPEQNRRMN